MHPGEPILCGEVSWFYGIIIRFYYRDHPPTHFHSIYGEHEALIVIDTGRIYAAYLPNTAYELVNSWRAITCKNCGELEPW